MFKEMSLDTFACRLAVLTLHGSWIAKISILNSRRSVLKSFNLNVFVFFQPNAV